MHQETKRAHTESGLILISTLFLMTLLLFISASSLTLSRTDVMISRNLLSGVQTLWIARAGLAVGKNWLKSHWAVSTLPVTFGPAALGNGTYTVEIALLGNARYRLTATGRGPESSRRVVEEIVQLPDFKPKGVVTNEGDGLHPDFDDDSSGIGHRIPDFSLDGRGHALDGNLTSACPAVSPFAVSQAVAQTDLLNALTVLKQKIVTRANRFCLADGNSTTDGDCTPGLSWVRGTTTLPRFTDGLCTTDDPACFLNLDLASAGLRATGFPPTSSLPLPPRDHGPFSPAATTARPVARLLTMSEQSQLHKTLDFIEQRITTLPTERVLTISSNITSGTHTYGSLAEPRVTTIDSSSGTIEIRGRATVNGAGILLVPRLLQLRDATLNWHGLVVLTGSGELQVNHRDTCGSINGAVIIRDDTTLERKFDLDIVEQNGSCTPFTVTYSCEAVSHALSLLMQTVSWIEKFDG
ncbi:MAG: hypothetical protein AB7G75_25285 [Candidatus Binatia bacterium]